MSIFTYTHHRDSF